MLGKSWVRFECGYFRGSDPDQIFSRVGYGYSRKLDPGKTNTVPRPCCKLCSVQCTVCSAQCSVYCAGYRDSWQWMMYVCVQDPGPRGLQGVV